MIKTFKKVIAVMLTFALLLSIVPFSAMASTGTESVTLSLSEAFYFNGSKTEQKGSTSVGGQDGKTTYLYVGSSYRAFVKLDLSEYREILSLPGTSIELGVRGGNGYSTGYLTNFKLVALPDSSEVVIDKSKTSASIKKTDYWDAKETDEVLYVRSDADKRGNNSETGIIDKNALVRALNDSYTNGVVQLGFYPHTGAGESCNIAINHSDTYIKITYNSGEINASAYLASLKTAFVWENISSDEITAVKSALPTNFGGANVSWSSQKGTVDANGNVKSPIGEIVTDSLTAKVEYNGASFEESFAITVPQAEAVSVNVPFLTYSSHRVDKPDQKGTPSKGNTYYVQAGTIYKASAQIDFSAYEEILRNEHTSVSFSIKVGNTYSQSSNSSRCYDFSFVTLPDELDAFDPVELTYSEAQKMGWFNTEGRDAIIVRSDATEIKGTVSLSGEVNKEALINALDESYNNGIISLGIAPGPSGKTSAFAMGYEDNYITITYYPAEVDNVEFLNAIKDEFVWDNLTTDSAAAVENSLPAYFRGAKVTWSSKDGLVNSDGTLNRSRNEALTGVISALVDYEGESFTKDFDITLSQILPTVITIKGATATYIDRKTPASAAGLYEKCYDNYRVENNGMYRQDEVINPSSGETEIKFKEDRMTFFKWDLKGYEAIIDAAKSVAVKWKNMKHGGNAALTLTVMNNVNDTWHNSTLTYDMAVETGMYTDPGVCSVTDIVLSDAMYITSDKLADGFREALDQNPENSIVSAKLTGQTWNGVSFRSSNRTYDLEVAYYPEDVKSEEEFIAEKVATMPWRAVSAQNIDEVLLDIELPSSIYGKDVEWVSSDANVISSSGEVEKTSADTTVKLTAIVDGKYTKTFDVTVPAKKFAVRGFSMCDSGSSSYINHSDYYFYATEEVTIPTLVLATYSNGSLKNLDIKKNYVIKAGETNVVSSLYLARRDIEVKAFFWDEDLGALKPLYNINNK